MEICARKKCKLEFEPYNAKQKYCCKKCTNAAYMERMRALNPQAQTYKKKDSHIPDCMTADRNAYDYLQA